MNLGNGPAIVAHGRRGCGRRDRVVRQPQLFVGREHGRAHHNRRCGLDDRCAHHNRDHDHRCADDHALITPIAGAAGVGDVAFPDLGNGGYDVTKYTIGIDARPDNPIIVATTRIDATATVDLGSFHLDLHAFALRSVRVDDSAAAFVREGDELIVTPSKPIAALARFSVDVAYDGVPQPLSDPDIGRVGWIDIGPTSYVVGEPHGGHAWFPGNDHPSDKATFEIRVTVPAGVTAVANGVLREKRDSGDSTTWTWDQREPMATYLAMVAIGDFTIQTGEGHTACRWRHVFATRLAPQQRTPPPGPAR